MIAPRRSPTRARQQHEERQQREREQRQPPVEQEHRDDRWRCTVVTFETIEVAVVVTTCLHAADVVGDARLDLAGARAREEREREPLQVAVDRPRAGRA